MKAFCLFHIFLVYIFLFSYFPGIGQSGNLVPEHFSRKNGLSDDLVLSIMQDSKGYLWIATDNGLNKYDGNRFTTYSFDPLDSTSLAKNTIFKLWEDKNGNIWVGTSETTCRFDPKTEKFTRFEKNKKNPYAFTHAYAMNEDASGRLWMGSWRGELRQVNKENGYFSPLNLGPHLNTFKEKTGLVIFTIFCDKAGSVWIGTNKGLHRLTVSSDAKNTEKINLTHYVKKADSNSISHNEVRTICEDNQGLLWIGTYGGGLNRLDPKTGVFTKYCHNPKEPHSISSDFITSINGNYTNSQETIWIGTSKGLNKFHPQANSFQRFFDDPTDPVYLTNTISSVVADRSGIIWIGTAEGVYKMDPHQKPFEWYHHNPSNPNSLSANKVAALLETKDRIVWVGTMGGGLNKLDRKTGKFTHYRHNPTQSNGLCNDTASALLEDRKGNIWIGSNLFLSQFNPQTNQFIHHSLQHIFEGLQDFRYILTIYQDKTGLLWLGTTHGLVSLDPTTGKTTHFSYHPNNETGLSDPFVTSILEDSRGNFWVGTSSQALNRLDRRTGKFTHYRHNRHTPGSISANGVNNIYEDTQGKLWFGTVDGGLCSFNYATETFTTYTRKQGLPGNMVYSILEDDSGNLWLGTNNGLSKFAPSEQNFTNFETSDGLQGNQFSLFAKGACYKGKDGSLYFGGPNGFNVFNPAEILPNTFIPPVVITQFSLHNEPVPGMQEAKVIQLNHDENFFSFEFAALNYTNPHKNQYAYQLQGVDKDWVYSGTNRLATYTDIEPGNYLFRVKASNNDGVWNEKPVSVWLVISPPFWLHPWMKGLYIVTCMLLLYLLYKFRTRQLALRTQHLENLVRDRTEALQQRSLQLEESLLKTRQQQQETEFQRQRAEEANRLKGELTNITVHDLKNPLGGIILFSDSLKKSAHDPQKVFRMAHTIEETSQKMLHVLSNLLKRARLESSFIQLDKEIVDLAPLVQTVVDRNEPQAIDKEQEFILKLEKGCYAEVDTELLADALENLISNAIKFSHLGKRIWINLWRDQDFICFSVQDEGPGIFSSEIDKLFMPFQRLSSRPTNRESSTGLGLAITKRIVELHNGNIKAESAGIGQGSTFTLQVPMARL